MNKYRSLIYVQHKDGSKPKGVKVDLDIKSGLFGDGMTKPFYTDQDEHAIIEHLSKGVADIFVSGKKVGSFKVPGETVVFI